MNNEYYDKIADLMLFCVDFREGDKLAVGVDPGCREAVKNLAYKAYEKGAAYVSLRYRDDFLNAAAIKAGKRSIEYPRYYEESLRESCEPGWKSISYMSFSEGDVYRGLPGDVSTDYFKQYQSIISYRRKRVLSDSFPWTLTFIPVSESAVKVFPELDTDEALNAYWQKVCKIMRLDLDDPVGFWRDKFETDSKRSRYLEELAPDFIEFKGPGTDFRVGVNKNARWMGGMKESATGVLFSANMPTDEIFTSPDFRKADGRVALTRPFVMHQNLGEVPENAWFEFQNGMVTDYGADKGIESLDALFARDGRARFLGEVALVDPQSPFAEGGLTYYNGLYDENAACHLALGAAYSGTLKTPGDYTDAQLLDMGMNTAAVHEDMMIGSSEVDVTALCENGKRVELIKSGKFLI
ncbi:MAG: aminopeptidase [Spirochaetales bacterium]|uniref:Aminopeptidase n=1 Tax=Candidatus Thalassospirochaeta sargassi TaxID=3119039 RepID=A0AAJ1MJN9_9SPIO|nr:aminopeptidase [Spirochaetales bacterium]